MSEKKAISELEKKAENKSADSATRSATHTPNVGAVNVTAGGVALLMSQSVENKGERGSASKMNKI